MDVPPRKADSDYGLRGVKSLSEELGGERQRADILEHVCYQGIVQWQDVDSEVKLGEIFGEASKRYSLVYTTTTTDC